MVRCLPVTWVEIFGRCGFGGLGFSSPTRGDAHAPVVTIAASAASGTRAVEKATRVVFVSLVGVAPRVKELQQTAALRSSDAWCAQV